MAKALGRVLPMPYSLHIQRDSSISTREWMEAAARIGSLRTGTGLASRASHDTSMPAQVSAADLEIIGPSGKWEPAFHFSEGRGSFSARSSHPALRAAAATLASTLGASIVGDDGERYTW